MGSVGTAEGRGFVTFFRNSTPRHSCELSFPKTLASPFARLAASHPARQQALPAVPWKQPRSGHFCPLRPVKVAAISPLLPSTSAPLDLGLNTATRTIFLKRRPQHLLGGHCPTRIKGHRSLEGQPGFCATCEAPAAPSAASPAPPTAPSPAGGPPPPRCASSYRPGLCCGGTAPTRAPRRRLREVLSHLPPRRVPWAPEPGSQPSRRGAGGLAGGGGGRRDARLSPRLPGTPQGGRGRVSPPLGSSSDSEI